MIDVFVLGVPFFVWLAAFIGIHIAVWVAEMLRDRRNAKRLNGLYSEENRHRDESDEED